VRVARHQSLSYVLGHGIKAVVACSSACTIKSSLILGNASARRFRLAGVSGVRLGSKTVKLKNQGKATVVVRFTTKPRRVLAKSRSIKVTLVTVATGANGKSRTINRTIRLTAG
jgi:hypothetical protein